MKIVDKIVEWWNKTFESDAKELEGAELSFKDFKDPVLEITFSDGTVRYCEIDRDPTEIVLQVCLMRDEPVFANFSVVERP